MHNPTFEEAARLWPSLSGRARIETDQDDELFAACEEVILCRGVRCRADALLVAHVLLDNLQLGQRSDNLDVLALMSLRDWLASMAEGGQDGGLLEAHP